MIPHTCLTSQIIRKGFKSIADRYTYPEINVHVKHRIHGKDGPDDHDCRPAVQVRRPI